jgi:hypothetical protein
MFFISSKEEKIRVNIILQVYYYKIILFDAEVDFKYIDFLLKYTKIYDPFNFRI